MSVIYSFRIADLPFSIYFCSQSQHDSIKLLPSFQKFRTENIISNQIFKLYINDNSSNEPSEPIGISKTYDTGNGNIVLYRKDTNHLIFKIHNTVNEKCCTLLTNEEFTDWQCYLHGDFANRSYGLNNALMLAFACRGSFYQAIIIHSSTIMINGKGYAFVAKSGVGKSTHTSLWCQYVKNSELLNDDNPIIKIENQKINIYGSPWSGKTHCYNNKKAELAAIVKICRSSSNYIKKTAGLNAFKILVESASVAKFSNEVWKSIESATNVIATNIPFYELHCMPDKDAAILCHEQIAR